MDQLRKYQARVKEFCDLNDMNLSERCRKVPEEKHFWNTQISDAKIKMYKMKKKRKTIDQTFRDGFIESDAKNGEVATTKQSLDLRVAESIAAYDEQIDEQQFLIDWLELNNKTISFIAQDFKNIIELKKVEEF